MGDPKFPRQRYETPSHPWQAARIKEEKELQRKYGLKSKTEVWKARSLLRSVRGQARDLQGKQRLEDDQVRRETSGLLARLHRIGILDQSATLDDVLSLNVEAVLTRRLQTQAYLKGLAATMDQARQLIVHGHIAVSGGRVTIPGYIVARSDEQAIAYAPGSPLENDQHPVRPRVLSEDELAARRAKQERREQARAENERGARRSRGGGSKPRGGRRHPPPATGGGES